MMFEGHETEDDGEYNTPTLNNDIFGNLMKIPKMEQNDQPVDHLPLFGSSIGNGESPFRATIPSAQPKPEINPLMHANLLNGM